MKRRIKAVSFGIGVIGSAVARAIIQGKKWIDLVGAIDIDPGKAGRDLGEVLSLATKTGVSISSNPKQVLPELRPDIVIHTTSSYFEKVYPELLDIVECGANVVSSCEELAYPYATDSGLARKLDESARSNDVTVLGTGINPGFLMDALPITLTGPCLEIDKINVARKMDAATRRLPFQDKIGAGLSPSEFSDAIRSKRISGHVGLQQSISMLCESLGWTLDRVVLAKVEPVILERVVQSEWKRVEAGDVAGLKQDATGVVGGEPLIEYSFVAYVGAEEEFDEVDIHGKPRVYFKSTPCVNGDQGTIAMLINMIPKVVDARPGLLTMKDLPLPSAVLPR